MKINVTKEHMRLGQPCSSYSCPVALAIRETIARKIGHDYQQLFITVDSQLIRIEWKGQDNELETIQTMHAHQGKGIDWPLFMKTIYSIDATRCHRDLPLPEPFSFEIDDSIINDIEERTGKCLHKNLSTSLIAT
jgi:hypothetical protein